jgi:hypothetical protein
MSQESNVAEHVPLISRRWPIACLIKYCEGGADTEPLYLVEWEPTLLTFAELCENLHGQPLLSQAIQLRPTANVDRRETYMVHWRRSWVPLSDLEGCEALVHGFWIEKYRAVRC